MAFVYSRVIRFADTDAAGVVYFANVLALCHEAYEAALAANGVDIRQFFSRGSTAVPIVHAEVDFRHPLHCGDRVTVDLVPKILGESKFAIAYQVYLSDTLAATAQTLHLCIDPVERKLQPLSPALQTWLASHDDEVTKF
ncbi:MAG: thioesterase family protein [Cyanobacteria bacterium P01_A01_bin.123]